MNRQQKTSRDVVIEDARRELKVVLADVVSVADKLLADAKVELTEPRENTPAPTTPDGAD